MLNALYTLYPGIFYTLVFILAACVGSFLNVVIYRLPLILFRNYQIDFEGFQEQIKNIPLPPHNFSLCKPASHCPHCQKPLSMRANVPVVSFLKQRGKCEHCATPISLRYPTVELLAAFFSIITLFCSGPTIPGLVSLLFVWSLVALIFIDLDYQILPDEMTLPLLWAGLLFNLGGFFVPLHEAVIGAIVGYLSLYLVYIVFKTLTGKEGMGFGDFKLLAAIGAWLGWQQLILTIILSASVAMMIGLALIAMKKLSREQPFPFGPFLAMGGLISLWWGQPILRIYFNWIGFYPS